MFNNPMQKLFGKPPPKTDSPRMYNEKGELVECDEQNEKDFGNATLKGKRDKAIRKNETVGFGTTSNRMLVETAAQIVGSPLPERAHQEQNKFELLEEIVTEGRDSKIQESLREQAKREEFSDHQQITVLSS